jgi:hypothetical protein
MPSDPELLPLAAAAKLVGKSVDTLRRWKRDGLLAFEGPDAQGRALVNRSALLLAAQGHARDTAPTRVQTTAWPLPPSIGAAAVQGELDAVRRHLASVEAERDRALAERDRALGEAKEARTELREARARLQAVEKELNGGVRGLLKRSFFG